MEVHVTCKLNISTSFGSRCQHLLVFSPQEANRTCSFAIPDGDSRFLINAAYENKTIPIDWNSITQDKTVPVGRLIIRNNVPMIMDADPHVPENNCQYYSLPFGPNQVVTSSFCCTEFWANVENWLNKLRKENGKVWYFDCFDYIKKLLP